MGKIRRHIRNHPDIQTRVDLIVHDIKQINKKIARSEYFFTDIKRDGIYLYNSGNSKLARRRKLKLEERREKAQEDFDDCFNVATSFFIDFSNRHYWK